jgi:hypothetical protein
MSTNYKGPKHVVGTHLYVTNIIVFLTDTLCILVYLKYDIIKLLSNFFFCVFRRL